MNRKSLIILLVVFAAFFMAAKPSPSQNENLPIPPLFYKEKILKGDYLGALLEFEKREADYRASKTLVSLFLQTMAPLESQVGNYKEAYRYFEEIKTWWKPQPDITSSPFDNDTPREALKVINSIADKQQVIMINEEHDTPMHRAFTARLLPILYKKGFRYFAAETIVDEHINKRGYPVQKSGFYSADPVYGDLVRTAIKLGFKVISYDLSLRDCKNPPDNADHCQNERERGQAQNLYDRILKNDPKAKVLVHVGRTHNQETKLDTWALMGWHFKQISGIDPFTIDQTQMSERSRPEFETAFFRYAVKKWNFTEPTVFQIEKGKYWSSSSYDLTVFHPRAIYKNGRPKWLEMGGERKSLTLFGKTENRIVMSLLPQPGGTFLVQAFVAGESDDAIPIDQIIITDAKNAPVLMLPKGNFRIKATDGTGKILADLKVAMK